MGLKLGCAFFDPGCCPSLPRCLCSWGSYVFLPCPLESARAADFNFRQWFTGVVFPGDPFDPLDAILKDLTFLSGVSSVVSPVRFSLSMSFSAFRISSVRRLIHLMCCRSNLCRVSLRWRNTIPCMAFRVAPLIFPGSSMLFLSRSQHLNKQPIPRYALA